MNALVIARLLGSMVISSCEIGRLAGNAVNKYLPSERAMDLDHMTGFQMEIMIHTLTPEQQKNLLSLCFGSIEQQQRLMSGLNDVPSQHIAPMEHRYDNVEETDNSAIKPPKPKWGFVGLSVAILFLSAYVVLPQAGLTSKDFGSWVLWIGSGSAIILAAWKGMSSGPP